MLVSILLHSDPAVHLTIVALVHIEFFVLLVLFGFLVMA
jgi:energy-converting hydrogenase Eha subunit C